MGRGHEERVRGKSGTATDLVGRDPDALRRTAVGLLAAGTLVGFSLATSALANAATPPKLATGGPAGEGPYPWKYPASGTVKVGSGTTIGGQPVLGRHAAVRLSLRRPLRRQVHRQQRRGHLQRRHCDHHHPGPARTFPTTANLQEVEAEARAAGDALPQVTEQVENVFFNYFNKVYDLYGRKVVIKPFTATATPRRRRSTRARPRPVRTPQTAKAMHAFGETGILRLPGRWHRALLAVRRRTIRSSSTATPTSTRAPSRTRTPTSGRSPRTAPGSARSRAEVVGTLLAGKKAVYAGDPTLRGQTRKFGTYVPNVPPYISCTEAEHQPARDQVPRAGLADRADVLLQPGHLDVPAVRPAGDRAVQGGRRDHGHRWPVTRSRPDSSPRRRRPRTTTPSGSSSAPR